MIISPNCGNRISLPIVIIIVTFWAMATNNSAQADSINPGLFAKDSSPFGIPYSDWISQWWQWNMEIPKEQHPRDNYAPEKCSINQDGPVWFLPDILTGREERTCMIPAGRGILVPLLTGEYHEDYPGQLTDSQIRQAAMAGNEYGLVTASLDGNPLKNLEQYRTQSFHNITVPQDNVFQNPPGTFKGMSDGFFIFLEPLPSGNHKLQLKTSVSNPIEPQYNYASEAIYDLIIKP
jgi:hypothetical protein